MSVQAKKFPVELIVKVASILLIFRSIETFIDVSTKPRSRKMPLNQINVSFLRYVAAM